MAQVSLFGGWTSRKVNLDAVTVLMDGDVNPFTNKPFSTSYRTILEKRKVLPVYGYVKEFYNIVSINTLRVDDSSELVFSLKKIKSPY
jgi:pre-mRNA-splicing factor ATP-dependent RNA helicase DHX15/PRP43